MVSKINIYGSILLGLQNQRLNSAIYKRQK